MTLPIAFPSVGVTPTLFDCYDEKQISRMRGRRTETNYTGPHVWYGAWTFRTLKAEADYAAVLRFLKHRGNFLAYDHFLPRPLAYVGTPLAGVKATGGAFNGDAAIQSITDLVTVVVEGLPANFVLTESDNIGFKVSNIEMSLHRLDEAVTANASGVATVKLVQPLPDTFTASATVHLEKPTCIMQITDHEVSRGNFTANASFSAVEVF